MSDHPIDPQPSAAPKAQRAYGKRRVVRRKAATRTAAASGEQGSAAQMHTDAPSAPPREMNTEERVTRVSREDRMVGAFDIPQRGKKAGRDYEWKVITVLNQPVDPANMVEVHEGGWRVETAKDWPTLMPPGTPPTSTIDRLGQRLFSRPMQLTQEARQEDYAAAEQQKRDRIQGALEGRGAGGHEGLADIRGIRPTGATIQVEGEVGSHVGAGVRR